MKNIKIIPLLIAIAFVLQGCATGSAMRELATGNQFDAPVIEQSKFLKQKENELKHLGTVEELIGANGRIIELSDLEKKQN